MNSIPRPDGLDLQPFVGLRYSLTLGESLADVLAPPYDVIDDRLRDVLLASSEFNVVRLTLPGADAAGYARAAATMNKWRADGVLAADNVPAIYVYEQVQDGHVQRGLVGALGLTPAEDGIVLPHENTMAGPVADRLALSQTVEANLEPIFLVYSGGGASSGVLSQVDQLEPLVDVVDASKTRHRLWAITDPATLDELSGDLHSKRAVIADGHHRYATYLEHQRRSHAAGLGAGPWDRGLAFLVDATSFGPAVHAIHRVIAGLNPARAIEEASRVFAIRRLEADETADSVLRGAAASGPAFVVSDGAEMWLLTEPDARVVGAAMPTDRSAAWQALDVNIAHYVLFSHVWGLDDREGVVDFVHDELTALAQARASGGTAVLLAPTPISAVAAVAEAGDRMPRKSTLFMPKPATGLVIRAFADQS